MSPPQPCPACGATPPARTPGCPTCAAGHPGRAATVAIDPAALTPEACVAMRYGTPTFFIRLVISPVPPTTLATGG